MRIESITTAAYPPSLIEYPPAKNCLTEVVSILLPKLAEFERVWELANEVCDRYLKTVAV
jgi:hypothetical protein